jgi:hypothetical protein
MLQVAEHARKQIALAIALINAALDQDQHPVGSACLVNRFALCTPLETFISSLGGGRAEIGQQQIKSLLTYVQKVIARGDPNLTSHSLMGFSANLILALVRIDRESARQCIMDLFGQVSHAKRHFTDHKWRVLLSFVVSLINVLVEENPNLLTPEFTAQVNDRVLAEMDDASRLPFAKMFIHMRLADDDMSARCFDYLAREPSEVISQALEKLPLIHKLIHEISLALSAGGSILMSEAGPLEVKRFASFANPLYLYGIFAIFLNIVDVIRLRSLLKNTDSNASTSSAARRPRSGSMGM